MDSFQSQTTSFIPKTRLTAPTYRPKGISLGLLISILLLLISLGLWGGLYLYKQSLQKGVSDATASLELAKKSFEPGLIADLNRLTFSINAAKIILDQHKASSNIFKFIQDFTLKDVRFSNFSCSINDKVSSVTMVGEAKSYTAVAFQAKLFENNEFIDHVIFSSLNLKEAGKVGFSVELVFKPSYIIYKPQSE
jgi:hypothetical protein